MRRQRAVAERHGTGLVTVACPAHGPCYWIAGVSFWALGPALAAAAVAQRSAEHTYSCPVWIRECEEGKPWTS